MSRRVAGWGAVAFAVTVVIMNVTENIGTSRPNPVAPPEEIAAWAPNGGPYLWTSTVLVPLAWILLAGFAATLFSWARSNDRDLFAPLLGVLGVAISIGTLSAGIAADAVMISSIERIDLQMVDVLSGFSSVVFVMNWVALALALYGLSRTVADMGLLPRWLDRVSLAGAGLLVIGSTQSAAVLEGFLPGILFGMVGFGIWLLFLIVSGLRLARS